MEVIIDGEEGPDFPFPRTHLQEVEIQRGLCLPCACCGKHPSIYQKSVVGTPLSHLVNSAPVWTQAGSIINLIPRLYITCECKNDVGWVYSTINPTMLSKAWNKVLRY